MQKEATDVRFRIKCYHLCFSSLVEGAVQAFTWQGLFVEERRGGQCKFEDIQYYRGPKIGGFLDSINQFYTPKVGNMARIM